ncbi:hypothetical protein NDU88_000513 [Pleurodeles waltl]|uniref:Uncharacterized protein n=1 Tax=Pleurodeles waltl TaxID=8319 RepID=A0AAV7S4T8_PLEWA|nr:hypothetical protein NDU88_000513 [Pleurodeles waltl]
MESGRSTGARRQLWGCSRTCLAAGADPDGPHSTSTQDRAGYIEPAASPLLLRGLQITGPVPGALCRTRGSLARSSLPSGPAPVPGPGRACLNQTGEPPSQGSPSPGFPSDPRARRHGFRVSEDQRGTPAASLLYPPGAPGHSPLQALQRRTRHSHRRRPRQRAGPDLRARRDAVSPAAILGDL